MDRQPRVLVVDDDEPVRHMVAMAFKFDGFDVGEAGDGVQAIAQVEMFHPDVVVLDIMMPRMDGLSTLGHLRQQPGTSGLPVVLLSAKAAPTDIAIGLRAGANDYVTKPFVTDDLLERARKVMEDPAPTSRAKIAAVTDSASQSPGATRPAPTRPAPTGLPSSSRPPTPPPRIMTPQRAPHPTAEPPAAARPAPPPARPAPQVERPAPQVERPNPPVEPVAPRPAAVTPAVDRPAPSDPTARPAPPSERPTKLPRLAPAGSNPPAPSKPPMSPPATPKPTPPAPLMTQEPTPRASATSTAAAPLAPVVTTPIPAVEEPRERAPGAPEPASAGRQPPGRRFETMLRVLFALSLIIGVELIVVLALLIGRLAR